MSQILTRFAEISRRDPTRPLLHMPAVAAAWSAGDLWDAHRRYADELTAIGVGPGQLVLSAAGNSPASVALLLACRAADVPIMPVDAGATMPEILAFADRFAAAAMIVPAALDMAPRDGRAPLIDLDPGLRLTRLHHRVPRAYPGAAILKLTSGSTGPVKATLTTEAQMVADGAHIVEAMGIAPSDTQIASIPISHAYGLGSLMMPLLMLGTRCVLRDSFVPHQLPADARRVGARIFPGVPFMFEYFLANPPAGGWPPTLQYLISAGAPLAPATVRAFHQRFGVKIHSLYGASETGAIAFDGSDDIDEVGVVGTALPGVTITLRDDPQSSDPQSSNPQSSNPQSSNPQSSNPQSSNPQSSNPQSAIHNPQSIRNPQSAIRNSLSLLRLIHVQSDAVADGYSDGTRDGFVDGGFLTADYGALDDRQRLTLVGRASSFVNVAGRKVQPDEVERILREMPGVRDVRVLAAPDSRRGQQIVACIVADPAARVGVLDVRRFCSARLASYKIPRSVVFLDALPITPRGKVDRAALDNLVRHRLGL